MPLERDSALLPFLESASDEAAERELTALVERDALPLARVIVARKFRSFRSPRTSPVDDRDDIVSEAMLALVKRLRQAREDPRQPSIGHFAGYVAAVVHSACAHAIRRRHPERARLKDRFRYLFDTDSRLGLWPHDDENVCGLGAWRGRAPDSNAARRLPDELSRRDRRWLDLDKRAFGAETVETLRAIDGPVAFDDFVSAAAASARLVEPQEVQSEHAMPSPATPVDTLIDQRRFLSQVWREVGALPVRQRVALLLNLRDSSGRGLLWLFPTCGIASVGEIATALEIPADEFATLWNRLPLDDLAIAARLGCERQQVINLRMAARKRLSNRAISDSFPAPRRKGA